MKKNSFICSIICALPLTLGGSALAQSTIAYFNGPAFGFGSWEYGGASLDMNRDGTADFEFVVGVSLTTFNDSGYTPYEVGTLNSNQMLVSQSQQPLVVPYGTMIGGNTSTNTAWTNVDGATLCAFAFNGSQVFFSSNGIVTNPPTEGWGGPVTPAGGAFLGVSFYAADGLHYGWIRAQLPAPVVATNGVPGLDGPPVILDWAFETRTNTAILAGAVPIPTLLAAPLVTSPGNLQLAWQSQINLAYQIQFKDQLDAIFWTNLGAPITAIATSTKTNVSVVGAARFYRVVQAN